MTLPIPSSVASTDGVQLAVHDLGGHGRPLLVSHATGFHGRCYLPMAAALADRFHSVAFDYRGHGDTSRPEGPVVWDRYGDDAVAMGRAMREAAGEPVPAFGHSMGGACLLMAAHREPGLFSRIVVFEPIVFPPAGIRPQGDESPLAAGARRRRATFPSYEAAIANYAAKPPLMGFTSEALDAYVRYGFAEGADGQVHLKCRPETEAETFEGGGAHTTWDVLPEIDTPVLVVAGVVQPMQPSSIAAGVAERLPGATYRELPEFDHFAPMTHPAEMAELVAAFLA
ncbi:MAG: alpha/beta hydrolase [Acidimicrobiales bacterium]